MSHHHDHPPAQDHPDRRRPRQQPPTARGAAPGRHRRPHRAQTRSRTLRSTLTETIGWAHLAWRTYHLCQHLPHPDHYPWPW